MAFYIDEYLAWMAVIDRKIEGSDFVFNQLRTPMAAKPKRSRCETLGDPILMVLTRLESVPKWLLSCGSNSFHGP
jgi:hypothetical protein